MNYLFGLGKDIVDRHTQSLEQEHARKTYYKVVSPDGTLTGRAFVRNGARHKALVAEGVRMRRLTRHDKQKMGNAVKYEHAYRSIASPCQGGCRRQYCGYCFLRKNGRCVPQDHKAAQRLLLKTMADKTWGAFKKEKNLAPTKLVCKLLREDLRYMEALAVREKTTTDTVFAFSEPLSFPVDMDKKKKRVQVPLLIAKIPASTSLALTVYTAPVADARASSSLLWMLVLWVVLMRVFRLLRAV